MLFIKLQHTNNHFLIISLLSTLCCSGSVLAYDSLDDQDVTNERQTVEYLPQGLRAGTFLVLPKFDLNNAYDTNIFRRDKTQAVESYVAHFKPGFNVRSDWNRHAFNMMFDTDFAQYANQGNQSDYEDIFTHLDGRLDVVRDSYLKTAFTYNNIHENRGSPDQINGSGPTFYNTKNIESSYTHKLNRMSIEAGWNTIRYDYQDLFTSLNTLLLMSSRNHWEHAPSIRLGYEIQPEYEAFLKVVYKESDYDNLVFANGFVTGIPYNRNSLGGNILTGLAFDLTDLITGDVSIGYLQRSYDDAKLPDISGINGFVNLKWRPTALTTITAKISHDIQETTQPGVSGILETSASLIAEHELLRNVIINLGYSIGQSDFQGFDITSVNNQKDRSDQSYSGIISAKYLLNRYVSTGLSYTYQSRDSNYSIGVYEVNQIMLNLRGQF